jgi:hypothetical protein
MGLFLACSCVVGAGRSHIQEVLAAFSQSAAPESDEYLGQDGEEAVYAESDGNTTVLYPDGFCAWDEASKRISDALQTTVFSFHIHDDDLWMFVAFRQGREVAWFNPLPDYWSDKISDEERRQWAGDASAVAGLLPGKKPEEFAPYFIYWSGEVMDAGEKARPDDEFPAGNCWQMVDFMRRCGFVYLQPREPSVQEEVQPQQASGDWEWERVRYEADATMARGDYRHAMELLSRIPQPTAGDKRRLRQCVLNLGPQAMPGATKPAVGPEKPALPRKPWWRFW